MQPFRFFQKRQLNLPAQDRFMELVNHMNQIPDEPEHIRGRHPQNYTVQMRMDIPLNRFSEDHRNHLKQQQERLLIENLSETLDFRHEVIYQDEFGFTLRTELFI